MGQFHRIGEICVYNVHVQYCEDQKRRGVILFGAAVGVAS
jgi:hypothetical protein